MTQEFYSHGKLLITSEYLVLDGAKALAIPTKKGQHLSVTQSSGSLLKWTSILSDGSVWIDCSFTLPLSESDDSKNEISTTLHRILVEAKKLNPEFLNQNVGYLVESTLEFPSDWGLGSSSTLLSNIAQWAQVNPYELLNKTFGGSGYDIACADAERPITYQNLPKQRIIETVNFEPDYKDELYFVHLNQKQNSRDSIRHYRSLDIDTLAQEKKRFDQLTDRILNASTMAQFESLVNEHELRLSEILKTETVKSRLFKDYKRSIKSLGGWGGDFIMVTGTAEEVTYFKNKGYNTIISFTEMSL